MKSIFFSVTALISAAALLAVSSCSFEVSVESTTEEAVTQTEPTVTVPDETLISTADPSDAPETSTDDSVSETETAPWGPGVVGISKKGYEIIEVDGVTYINGVLVVNKTYSVPKDYSPGNLTPECSEAFSELVAAAAADGLNIFVASGYRSYATQAGLYDRYCRRDGQAKADTYSARPGHSEHQTGLAIDVNSVSYSFANTPEGQWIAANSYKYGFIVRYGQNKEDITGYAYEPWHIRYVGVAMAQAIYDSGLCLEEYLDRFGLLISRSYSFIDYSEYLPYKVRGQKNNLRLCAARIGLAAKFLCNY